MDREARHAGSVLDIALGTLNLCLFFVLLVLAGHLTGVLGDLLGSLDTLPGLAAFGLLWLVFGYTTFRARGEAGIDATRSLAPDDVVAFGAKWGALGGMAIFGVIALVAVGVGIFSLGDGGSDVEDVLDFVVFGFAALCVGTFAAGAVGLSLGVVFALLDYLLLAVARGLVSQA